MLSTSPTHAFTVCLLSPLSTDFRRLYHLPLSDFSTITFRLLLHCVSHTAASSELVIASSAFCLGPTGFSKDVRALREELDIESGSMLSGARNGRNGSNRAGGANRAAGSG